MKITFSRTDLLSELQLVARATAVRSALPSLVGVLLTAAENEVALAGTDTEIGLRSKLEGKVEQPGSALVPGRLLVEILRALDGDEITLAAGDGGQIEVTSGKARFVMRSLSAQDFPNLPAATGDGVVTIPAPAFAHTVERVARAASRDETRPVLTGVLVSVENKVLKMVATDSYRLSVKETPLPTEVSTPFEANVPARALQELTRVVSDRGAEQVAVAMQDNQIVFAIDGVVLSSRMIDGQFPNYRQLLPESYEHEIQFSRPELSAIVRRISLMAQRNAPLRLAFEDGSVTVSAQTPDVGEASEALPVNFQGERLEIGFNPQFLQDGLEGVGSDDLRLRLISPLRPGLIEAASGDGEDKFLYLIMPVRLNV